MYYIRIICMWSRDSYGLDGLGSIPVIVKICFFSTLPRPSLRTTTASYAMGTGSSFPGVDRPGREADHSPTSSAEVKVPYVLWRDA
jgi:hypothetical protein